MAVISKKPKDTHDSDPVNLILGTDESELIFGSDRDDIILARGGDDDVEGGAGNDTIHGGSGNDHLSSGLGNNVLIGGRGDDYLTAYAGGHNVMIGGKGADTYQFSYDFNDSGVMVLTDVTDANNPEAALDKVYNFNWGDNLIDVSQLDVESIDEITIIETLWGNTFFYVYDAPTGVLEAHVQLVGFVGLSEEDFIFA